jgi:hypothetical protein
MPFVIGEFGNYGAGSQAVDVDSLVYDGALSTTEYLIRMLNNGVAGLARWEFHIYGDTWRNLEPLHKMIRFISLNHMGRLLYTLYNLQVCETRLEGNGNFYLR